MVSGLKAVVQVCDTPNTITGRAARTVAVMPEVDGRQLPVDRYLRSLYSRFIGLDDGAVADYIPPLAAADPNRYAICIATVDGQLYEVGDTDVPFTIQSISKPFTYGLALEDRGLPEVLRRIGVEPSGDAFNEISLDQRGRPFNPMINAGAIMAASLISGDDPLARLIEKYSTWAGRDLAVDDDVYRAERETGHRNRAISHMLRAVGTLEGDPERALDIYFQQCSVEVTNRDLAVMAATLAARGVNPLTGKRALADGLVDHVLSLMTTCGMYDAAGEWLVDVGIPAKSGVGGGIIGVLPGQLGISVFSPRLDSVGNSARGVATFRQLAADLRLHFLNVGRSSRATVSVSYPLADVPSTRDRTPAERAAVDRGDAVIFQLAGDVLFAGAETVSRAALNSSHKFVVLDLTRAGVIDPAATRVLAGLARELARSGDELVLAAAGIATETVIGARSFPDLDAAKEWCEEQLVLRAGAKPPTAELILSEHPLAKGLSSAHLAALAAMAEVRTFDAGEQLVERGGPADEVFLLMAGEVEASVLGSSGARRRLAVLVPGAIFGESAVTRAARRTADLFAATAGECLVLTRLKIEAADPDLRATILAGLLDIAHEALARSTREIAALSR
ncbi:MAG: glsA [Pseudonocardiales bacterium]|nr:glsA [Pseudonocardiales bacterium]